MVDYEGWRGFGTGNWKRGISVMNDDRELDEFFLKYRNSCPDPEPSADFMPKLWKSIDKRRGFLFTFQQLARVLVTASAAACLILAALNVVGDNRSTVMTRYGNYTDVLSADGSLEKTYYSESTLPQKYVGSQFEH
jgi:hypothetical protein